MSLSLCIATYNESQNIARCISAVLDICEEVVIVDGGSTDDTVQIARSYGDKVKVIPAVNVPTMFHINKQKSIEAATSDWVLSLDSDEVVTPQLKTEILQIMANPQACIAYQVPRLNWFLGRFLRKGGVYPDYTIRLFKTGQMYYPCLDIHENVEPTNPDVRRSPVVTWLGTCESPLEHYGDPNFSRYIRRWARNNAAEAQRVKAGTSHYLSSIKNKNLRILVFVILSITFYPYYWFAKTYFRHKGFADGWQGFVFHFFSSLRFVGIGWRLVR